MNTGNRMFTGIIIGVGKIGAVRHGADGLSMDVDTAGAVPDPVIGESVALNGVCLTVTAARGPLLTFDVSGETLRRTTLSDAAPGRDVNIERALRLGDRLGGHLVQGHVDGVGTVAAVTPAGEGYDVEIELAKYVENFTRPLISGGGVNEQLLRRAGYLPE
ncbi:MAG: hypothetical protein HY804_03260 [Nitrospinae bacterium]|nr:hypothetical protein [Nitrospinota bacterium]